MEIREIQEDLEKFENLIKMYNFEFNNYFLGNMKFPPVVREREINKIIKKYNINQITNPTLRFKFNNLVARFLTYRERWNKKMMELEGVKKSPVKTLGYLNIESDNGYNVDIDNRIEKELEKLPDSYNKEGIRKMIMKKIETMKKNGVKDIDLKIEHVNGKPKLLIRQKK
ncbi:hypothetical protein DEFDS_0629 [Deferribacter desulfuricans SSM1]|uniref:Uncharacterized protein n=1 Tax=Deferribacter desulfuricans (strain DSM 14783 / JCM 11476 / NBRC 101012 / SSM1) TaxID=639282 RepID=D3PBY7_DEFDS|nr:hypothetical protein [Deferribacter desulfuricans]BAI80110.1 hypothetical protein DEFDS_0629 [Deferribacter desulfuricans SSM1]